MSEVPQSDVREALQVDSILAIMVDQLASLAWQKMGLQPDPIIGGIDKDLSQCRRAIDAVEALARILEPQLDEDDRRQVQNLVRDLKLNFVEHSR